jgi:hypothetical protein
MQPFLSHNRYGLPDRLNRNIRQGETPLFGRANTGGQAISASKASARSGLSPNERHRTVLATKLIDAFPPGIVNHATTATPVWPIGLGGHRPRWHEPTHLARVEPRIAAPGRR